MTSVWFQICMTFLSSRSNYTRIRVQIISFITLQRRYSRWKKSETNYFYKRRLVLKLNISEWWPCMGKIRKLFRPIEARIAEIFQQAEKLVLTDWPLKVSVIAKELSLRQAGVWQKGWLGHNLQGKKRWQHFEMLKVHCLQGFY